MHGRLFVTLAWIALSLWSEEPKVNVEDALPDAGEGRAWKPVWNNVYDLVDGKIGKPVYPVPEGSLPKPGR